MPVEVIVETTLVDKKGAQPVPGISVTCGRCDLCVEAEGDDDEATLARAIRKLKARCDEPGHRYVRAE